MIISHKHKFVFIKTRKTAGTSIEIALSGICGEKDILTPINEQDEILRKKISGKHAQNYYIPFSKYSLKDWLRLLKHRKRLTFYNHMSASSVKKVLGDQIWKSYYTFCFERHPLNKSISHYKWRGKKEKYPDFKTYINSSDVKLIKGDYFYKDISGVLLVDKVYKMEEMEEAFAHISKKIGISNVLFPPNFKTKKSVGSGTPVDPVEINKKYGKVLKSIFNTEYTEIYHNT